MPLATRASALQDLQELGLLAEPQRLAALSHPRLNELPEQPDAHATLEWLLRTEVIDTAGLLEMASRYRPGESTAARRTLVTETLTRINQASVDALLASGLITPDIHQVISESIMTDRALLTPAATMALVMEAGMLPWDEYAALRTRPASAHTADANAILAETDRLIEERNRTIKREFWAQTFPGPRWLYVLGALLLIGGVYWYNTASNAVPGCASEEARKTIDGTILLNAIRSHTKANTIFNGAGADSKLPSVRDLREVGYNKVSEIRGCSAQLTVDDETAPFGYVIKRNPDRQEGGFVLHSAEPEIIKARFGTLDAQGDFVHKAEPIGRSNLEQAFHAGTAALADDPVNRRVAAMMRNLNGQRKSAEPDEPKRNKDIEPLGACRAIKPGMGYVCPLLVEWDNPMMALLGHGGSQILRGDFTFEPNTAGATPAWRVSENFAEEMDRAKLAAPEKKPLPEDASAAPAR
jgi:hypothetical protein